MPLGVTNVDDELGMSQDTIDGVSGSEDTLLNDDEDGRTAKTKELDDYARQVGKFAVCFLFQVPWDWTLLALRLGLQVQCMRCETVTFPVMRGEFFCQLYSLCRPVSCHCHFNWVTDGI